MSDTTKGKLKLSIRAMLKEKGFEKARAVRLEKRKITNIQVIANKKMTLEEKRAAGRRVMSYK